MKRKWITTLCIVGLLCLSYVIFYENCNLQKDTPIDIGVNLKHTSKNNGLNFTIPDDFDNDSSATSAYIEDDMLAAKREIQLEEEREAIKKDSSKRRVILQINAQEITQGEYEIRKSAYVYGTEKNMDKKALVDLMISKLLIEDAKMKGVVFTVEDALNALEPTIKAYRQEDFDIPVLREYLELRGISGEAYIEECIQKTREEIPESLYAGKASYDIRQMYLEEMQDETSEAYVMTEEEFVEQYQQNMLEKADIIFYDENLEAMFQ